MLRPNNFKNPEAEEVENSGELFSSSPVPDRYSTPRVNLTARSVFDVEPGSGPPAPIVQPLFAETDQVEVPSSTVTLDTSFESAAVVEATTPGAATRSRNNSPLNNSAIKSPEKPVFLVGDLVWAQTDVQFASWPALVIDPSNLPETLQEAYHFTARNGKSNKIPVYFYGKNDYDVVLPARMKDYNRFRDTMKSQNITGKLYVMFRRAVRLADENQAKEATQRTEWMIKSRSDTSAGLDPKEPYLRTNSGNSSVASGSGLGSRKTSMQISTTESQDGSTIYGNAALQMSPLSDTYTAGGFTPTPGDATRPSRFPFPEHTTHPAHSAHAIHSSHALETVVEGIDASPAPPLDHKTTSLLETLPLLNVLGSPRRSSPPQSATHAADAPADHAALMAIASEAVDRALLDNYEIVDLSPGQKEEQVQQALHQAETATVSVPVVVEALKVEKEVEEEVLTEVALDTVSFDAVLHITSETATESVQTHLNASEPTDSMQHTEFSKIPMQHAEDVFGSTPVPNSDFFPPVQSESDIFSQISPSGSEMNTSEDFFGSSQPAESSEHTSSESIEPNSAAELTTDTDEFASALGGEGSVTSDFLHDVPLDAEEAVLEETEQHHTVRDIPVEEQAFAERPVFSIESTAADVFEEVALSASSPFDALPIVSTTSNAEESLFGIAPLAVSTSAEPPRPYASFSPPRSPLPQQTINNISTFSTPEKPQAAFYSPSKSAGSVFGAAVVPVTPPAKKNDASALFGGSNDAGSDPFAPSVGAGGDLFGAPPVNVSASFSTRANHADASNLFGSAPGASSTFAPPPISTAIAATTAANTSASENDLFGPPAPSLPAAPTPPYQRGTSGTGTASGGRSATTPGAAAPTVTTPNNSAVPARGIFDSTPAVAGGGDLFGAPPTASAVPSKKVVAARLTPTASASDLFGSAPAAADSLFGGAGAARPAPVPVSAVRGGASAADSLFGGPSAKHDPFGAPPSLPQARTTVAVVSAAGVFGDTPTNSSSGFDAVGAGSVLSKKASFKNSPSRPVGDAASLFGGSSGGAGDLFGSGGNASANSGPFSSFSAPPAASEQTATNAFGPPPATAHVRTPTGPPVPAARTLTHAAAAADLFGGSNDGANGVFDLPVSAPPPHIAQAAQVFAPAPPQAPARAHPPSPPTVPQVLPPSQVHAAAHTDTAAFFGADLATSVPITGSAVVSATSPVAAAPVVASKPTTPVNSAHDLFGAPPAATVSSTSISHADSADSLFTSANNVTQESVVLPPSPVTRTHTAPVNATVHTLQIAAEAASSAHNTTLANTTTQPILQRNVSAGPVFKGKAKLLDGASPFDAPASTANTADVLFGGGGGSTKSNASANSMFGGSSGNSADLFGTAPANNNAFGVPHVSTATSSVDLFSAPPPGASSPFTGSNTGAGGGSSKKFTSAKNSKAQLSASDVFSSHAPVEAAKPYAALVDPLCPPSAPGVKVTPKLNINTTSSNSPLPQGGAGVEPFSPMVTPGSPFVGDTHSAGIAHSSATNNGAVGISGASTSSKLRTAPVPKGKKAPPPGMIATPHGYVPIASLGVSGAPVGTSGAGEVGVGSLSKPLVSHTVLTSLVTEVAEEEVLHSASEDRTFTTSATTAINATATAIPTAAGVSATAHPTRDNRVKPTATVVSFGFGGKLVCMTPRQHAMAAYNPMYGTQEAVRGQYCGPVRVYNMIEVVNSGVRSGVSSAETTELCKLLTLFPGPLFTHQPSVADPAASAHPSTASSEELVREALQHRIDCPLSGLLAEAGSSAGCKADPSSEKLLWSLLKLCVDRNGVLCGGSGADGGESATAGASAAEVRICQLLMGHAATATTGSAASVPNVSVFSGSANGTLASYTPDMSKSALLHANFHSHAANGGDATDSSKAPVGASGTPTAEQYTEIEALLVVGRKEDALRKAIQCGEWSLALLIGSVCGPEKYSEVVHTYSSNRFPKATPLHLLTLMYADVGSSIVLNTTANTTGGVNTTSSSTTITNTGSGGDALTLWRHNLSAILSNKPSNWQQLASFLGYRLHTESKDIYAAHSAYLTAGAYPTFPVSSSSNNKLSHATSAEHLPAAAGSASQDTLARHAGKYSLLGCDVSLPKHRALSDCTSISALRGTEILEYALTKRLKACNAAAASGSDGIASGGIGKSITDIFGWKSSGGSAVGSVPPKSPRRGQSSSSAVGPDTTTASSSSEARLRYQASKVRVVLCPLKLRFAMVLADFGLLRESAAYALEARALVQEIGIAEDKNKVDKTSKSRSAGGITGPNPSTTNNAGNTNTSSSSTEPSVKPFNRHFVRALDEFIDRLGVTDQVRAAGTLKREGNTGATTSSSAGSGGGWGSMISGINLKNIVDMVDGPNAASAPGPAATTPTAASAPVNSGASNIWSTGVSVFDVPPINTTPSMPPSRTASSNALSAPPPSTSHSAHPAHSGAYTNVGGAPSVYGNSGSAGGSVNAGGALPPHPAGHAPLPPAPHTNTSSSGAHARAAAPASTAQYASMSALPPRPGNMVVPPSAHVNSGALPHSTSQGNLQSVQGIQSVQGPPAAHSTHTTQAHNAPPAHSSHTSASASFSGGSDFFEDVDLQSPDKQHHFNNTNTSGAAGGMYGYPSNTTANANTAAPYTSAPYTSNTANHAAAPPSNYNPSAWGNNNASNSSGAAVHAHNPGSSTPPTNMYGAANSNTHQNAHATPASTAPPASSGFFGFGGASAAPNTNATANTGGNGHNTHAPHTTQANTAPPATTASALPPKHASAPAASAAAAASAAPASSGLFGNMRKSLLTMWYPDAHDANDNIGKSLEAVYNKETGRWEFPGEENAAPSPSSLPPPTGPMGGGSGGASGMSSGLNSSGVSPSPSMSAFGNVGIAGPPGAGGGGASSGVDSGAYDPMAAMMAPPSRRMPSSYSTPSLNTTADMDPLAAMMAPPSSRYSMPHASSTMNMQSASMPQINVWKPPPVAAAAHTPVVMPAPVHDDGAASSSGGAYGTPYDNNTSAQYDHTGEGPPVGAGPPTGLAPPPM